MVNLGVELPTYIYVGSKKEENLLCSGVYTSRDSGQTVNIVDLNLGSQGKSANLTLEEVSEIIEAALAENDIDYSEDCVSLIVTEYSAEDLFSENVSPEDFGYSATIS